jgi:hypothetical protein
VENSVLPGCPEHGVWNRPQHPAAHGVLRMILEMNGEEILRVDPVSCTALVSRGASTHAVDSTLVFYTVVPRNSLNIRHIYKLFRTLIVWTMYR